MLAYATLKLLFGALWICGEEQRRVLTCVPHEQNDFFFFRSLDGSEFFVWGVVVAAEAPTAMWKAIVPGDECASCAIVQDGSGVVHNEASAGR